MAYRIGQILIDLGVLSQSQVDQILEHQKLSRQRFGQIAVAWGWAKPQDVWQAWARQLACNECLVDLDEIGVDTAATERVPPAIARHYRVVAIRTWGENLVLAVPDYLADAARRELPTLLGGSLYFCRADTTQIDQHLDRIYAVPVA